MSRVADFHCHEVSTLMIGRRFLSAYYLHDYKTVHSTTCGQSLVRLSEWDWSLVGSFIDCSAVAKHLNDAEEPRCVTVVTSAALPQPQVLYVLMQMATRAVPMVCAFTLDGRLARCAKGMSSCGRVSAMHYFPEDDLATAEAPRNT